jgi:hypothetical protein
MISILVAGLVQIAADPDFAIFADPLGSDFASV